MSVEDLIKNKKQVGHPQDLLDVVKLEALSPKRPLAHRAVKPKRSKPRAER